MCVNPTTAGQNLRGRGGGSREAGDNRLSVADSPVGQKASQDIVELNGTLVSWTRMTSVEYFAHNGSVHSLLKLTRKIHQDRPHSGRKVLLKNVKAAAMPNTLSGDFSVKPEITEWQPATPRILRG